MDLFGYTALPVLSPRHQIFQRHIELDGDRLQHQHRGIVDPALQSPHHIGMDTSQTRQGFLAQLFLDTPFPDFLSQTTQYRS
jgi:hypothetical protein